MVYNEPWLHFKPTTNKGGGYVVIIEDGFFGKWACIQITEGSVSEKKAEEHESNFMSRLREGNLGGALDILVYCEQEFLFGGNRVNKLFKKLAEAEKLLFP